MGRLPSTSITEWHATDEGARICLNARLVITPTVFLSSRKGADGEETCDSGSTMLIWGDGGSSSFSCVF